MAVHNEQVAQFGPVRPERMLEELRRARPEAYRRIAVGECAWVDAGVNEREASGRIKIDGREQFPRRGEIGVRNNGSVIALRVGELKLAYPPDQRDTALLSMNE